MAKAHVEIRSRWIRHAPFKRDGSEHFSCKVRDKRTGRMHFISTREKDRRKAEQAILHWIEERERREVAGAEPPQPRRFDITFREWMKLKTCRPSTIADYQWTFDGVFKGLHEVYLEDFEAKDVERFLKKHETEKKSSGRTLQKHLFLLRSFFEWCRLHGYVNRNPCDGVKAPRGAKKRGVALSIEEARKLLVACREETVHELEDARRSKFKQGYPRPKHLWIAVAIACLTGLRRGNVIGLKWGQVDMGKRKISIAAGEMKGHADHESPINQELHALLEGLLQGKKRVDPEARVIGADVAAITTSFKSALERAGLPEMRWHDLRHSFATWMSTRASFAALRQLMGHSPGASVTLAYTHVPFGELLAAVDTLPPILSAPAASAAAAAASSAP